MGFSMSDNDSPTDEDFFYLGFTSRQVFLLKGHSNSLRRTVYEEGLRILMENGPGYDGGQTVTP